MYEEPPWARMEARLSSIEARLNHIEGDGLEGRVSTLERTMHEIASTIKGVSYSVKFVGGALAVLWTGLQIINLLRSFGVV